jgi:hypothetical protein
MAGTALRDGFREVLNDPGLLLIEIAWRWSFGVIAFFVFALSVFLVLGGITGDPHRLEALVALSPWQLAQKLAASVATIGLKLLRVTVAAGLILSLSWIVLSSAGRHATLARHALAPGATLRACFALNAARAAITVASIIAWMAAGVFAGFVGASGHAATPDFASMAAILLPTLLVIVAVWVTMNWYLSLAPLFPEETWIGSIVSAWHWCRANRDELFEISIAITVIRAMLLVIALMLSFAVSAVVTNVRVVVADLLAVGLLYLLIADFFCVARLAAYARLRQREEEDSRALGEGADLSAPTSDSFQSLS